MTLRSCLNKVRYVILPNVKYLWQSEFRTCGCCLKRSIIVSLSEGEETKICIRCRANLRYEMLAEFIRRECHDLKDLVVLELDPSSPLRSLLSKAKKYTRTYYSPSDSPGFIRTDGARCEDITKLSLDDCSVDVLISSDVLEHVPDIAAAFMEVKRVLRPGGFHVFTVPPKPKTLKRAEIRDGKVVHIMKPDYHKDPLNPEGILAFWDFGPDAIEMFSENGLEVAMVDGPKGKDGRILWKAEKR